MSNIISLSLLILVFALIVYVLISDLVLKIKGGWRDDYSMQYVSYVCFVLIWGFEVCFLIPYFSSNGKELRSLNNELYKKFLLLESKKKTYLYDEYTKFGEDKRSFLKINKIFSRKRIDFCVTSENLKEIYDDNHKAYIGNYEIGILSEIFITKECNKIKSPHSENYEDLYRAVHSRDLLKEKKLKIMEVLLPFSLAVFSILIAIYQTLSKEESLNESLFSYLILFITTLVYGLIFAFHQSLIVKNKKIEFKKKQLELLDMCLNMKVNSKKMAKISSY